MLKEKSVRKSKKAIVVMLLGALGFVALGAWMSLFDSHALAASSKFNNPLLLKGIGLVCMVVFGGFAAAAFKLLFDDKPGLVVNQHGILDNSSALSAGMIPWADITAIRETEIQNQKTLSIMVTDPQKYIDRGNVIQKMLKKINVKLVGTPVNITASSLQMTHDEMAVTIFRFFHIEPNQIERRMAQPSRVFKKRLRFA